MIEFALNFAKKASLQEVHLYTNELMTENIRYYLGFEFVEVERRLEDGYKRVYFAADLRRIDLIGANLTKSIFVTQAQINVAKGDTSTKLPS